MAIPERLQTYQQPEPLVTHSMTTPSCLQLLRALTLATTWLTYSSIAHAGSSTTRQPEFQTEVILKGLTRPTGIAIHGDSELYFTEIPNPGKPNMGNAVKKYDLEDGELTTVHIGEPEPTNLALDKSGGLYWTCKSAGVILFQPDDETPAVPLLRGLTKPSGVSVDRWDNVYFTQVPTPGVPGTSGGQNNVSVYDGKTTTILNMGEPEPTDIVVDRHGEAYWTCRTAGVILQRDEQGKVSPLLKGLNKPVGIAINRKGTLLYWTEVPTPGIGGAAGGQNKIWELNMRTGEKTLVHAGDPEPTDITVGSDGSLYWTCSSAGVIVEAKRKNRRY